MKYRTSRPRWTWVNVTSQNRPSFSVTNKDVICFFLKKHAKVIVKISFVPSGIKNIDIAMKKTDKNAFGNLEKYLHLKHSVFWLYWLSACTYMDMGGYRKSLRLLDWGKLTADGDVEKCPSVKSSVTIPHNSVFWGDVETELWGGGAKWRRHHEGWG